VKRNAPLLLLLLTGCAFGGGTPPQSAPHHRAPTAVLFPTPRSTQICYADLSRDGIRFSPLPDHDYGGGCNLTGTVQLIDVGVPITGIKGMRCGLARDFVGWIRHAVAPAARQILGSDVVKVETMGTYSCRNVVGNAAYSGKLSGHAIANAVDVSGFRLADGRRITVLADWRSQDPATRSFFATLHTSACKRFGTVLSPDYNAAHANHLHLEADRANFCR